MQNYKLLSRAGEGAHGFVFKGVDLQTNTVVALKKLTFNPQMIVELLEVTSLGSGIVLVMEFLPCSLAEIIKKPLNLPQIKTYTKMIFNGISFMHQHNIMHRDIKPANLLINDNGLLKIADFGLARIYNPLKQRSYSHQVATRWYRSPELLYGSKSYTNSVDIWAAGCILAEMFNNRPLFPGETDIEQLAIVLSILGTPTEESWPNLKNLPDYNKIDFTPSVGKEWTTILPNVDQHTIDLISKILVYNEMERLTAVKVLEHRFFNENPLPADLVDMPKPKNVSIEEHVWNFEKFDTFFNQI